MIRDLTKNLSVCAARESFVDRPVFKFLSSSFCVTTGLSLLKDSCVRAPTVSYILFHTFHVTLHPDQCP